MRPLKNGQQVIRAVEDASSELEGTSDRPVQLRDIAAALGMSERTLRRRFEVDIGTSPMRYLRHRRLAMAQQALQQAATQGLTVTAVALIHGFPELGRFAVEYRRLFGESPSATLRRSANDPGSPAASAADDDGDELRRASRDLIDQAGGFRALPAERYIPSGKLAVRDQRT